jgi:hypothetical protein
MDYGKLIRDAWEHTWHHRALWILGLLPGGGTTLSLGNNNGASPGWRLDTRDWGGPDLRYESFPAEAATWLAANAGLVGAGIALFIGLGVMFFVLSLIAQGGMSRATIDLEQGRAVTLAQAWQAGTHYFVRYLGLTLVFAALAITAALVVAFGVSSALVAGSVYPGPIAVVAIARVIALGIALIPVILVLTGIVFQFAERAIAERDEGPVAAIKDGWRIFREHPGNSFLVWLLSVLVGIVGALAIGVGVAVTAIPLAVIAIPLFMALGPNALTVALATLGVLAMIGAALLVGAAVNTYLWNYWTIAYLRIQTPQEVA